MATKRKKLVIVRDGACGKTSILIVLRDGTCPDMYIPTVFETYVTDIEVDGHQVRLLLVFNSCSYVFVYVFLVIG